MPPKSVVPVRGVETGEAASPFPSIWLDTPWIGGMRELVEAAGEGTPATAPSPGQGVAATAGAPGEGTPATAGASSSARGTGVVGIGGRMRGRSGGCADVGGDRRA